MQRVALLVAAFEHIARTRMAGVPLLHAALRTEAVGFQPQADDDGEAGLLGVLVTPWFMNLLWLPGAQAAPLALGATRPRRLGGETLSFLAGEEDGCRFEACSLFSPMFEFADQDAARAVALAALGHLRRPAALDGPASASKETVRAEPFDKLRTGPVEALQPDQPASPSTSSVRTGKPGTDATATRPNPTRRGLLFGRRAAEAAR